MRKHYIIYPRDELIAEIATEKKKYTRRLAYLWMLAHAEPRATIVQRGKNGAVPVEKGELAVTLREMATAWKWSVETVRRFLGEMIDADFITVRQGKGKRGYAVTVIQILNYNPRRESRRYTSKRHELAPEAVDAKIALLQDRRAEFNRRRPQLALAMIDAGVEYRCVHPGCLECTNLEIDHRIPLSRGGSDDLDNLQFMCGGHNRSKKDRVD